MDTYYVIRSKRSTPGLGKVVYGTYQTLPKAKRALHRITPLVEVSLELIRISTQTEVIS